MKDSIADLRNKWKLFYNKIDTYEKTNIVVYFDFGTKGKPDYKPYSLTIIQVEVVAKTKLARKMLKHLVEIGLL